MRPLHDNCVCRLCLRTGCHFVDILEENRDVEFLVKQGVEDLLQLVVVKQALHPWLVCSICVEKLREFHVFKRSCVENQDIYDSQFGGIIPPKNDVWSTDGEVSIKLEEDDVVENPLHNDSCKNIENDHSNHPNTQGLTIDYQIPMKSEENDAVEYPLHPDACKSIDGNQSNHPITEDLIIDSTLSMRPNERQREDNLVERYLRDSDDEYNSQPESPCIFGCITMGDSLAVGLALRMGFKLEGVEPNCIGLCHSDCTVWSLRVAIEAAPSIRKTKVLLMVGTVDLMNACSVNKLRGGFYSLIRLLLQRECRMFIVAPLPSPGQLSTQSGRTRLASLLKWLRKWEKDRLTIIEVDHMEGVANYERFVEYGETGWVDAVNPNEKGYRKIIRKLKEKIKF